MSRIGVYRLVGPSGPESDGVLYRVYIAVVSVSTGRAPPDSYQIATADKALVHDEHRLYFFNAATRPSISSNVASFLTEFALQLITQILPLT
jgi:hypothetical protein